MSFATNTWHGWDYIPNAWPVWLDAPDAAFLAGTVGTPNEEGGAGPVDVEGNPLSIGQPVAITRVAMVSPTEAWLEGIRVDPLVRGMNVAADLQVAELHWVLAQKADIVRYATAADNEGSHRLGARDGITPIAAFSSWFWSATGSADDDDAESAYDPDVRAMATMKRRALLAKAAKSGLVATAGKADALWRLVSADPTFKAEQRLYEPRPWAMQELTEALFHRHVERGELMASRMPGEGRWAVAILINEQLPGEDSSLRLALLVGGAPAAQLANEIRSLAGESIRFRVPKDAPMIAGREDEFRRIGFVTPDWELHVLARQMDADHPIPEVDPARVVLAEAPQQSLVPPRW